MKVLETIGNTYRKVMWKIYRFLYRVEVHVFPKSPYFPAHTEVIVLFLTKFDYKAETLRINMDETGHVDVQQIFDTYPGLHNLHVHYPEDWDDQMEHFHAKLMRQTGKQINGYREDSDR